MQSSRISIVVALALVGGALSGLLLFEHHGVGAAEAAVGQICGPDDVSGCEQVSQSRYSSVAGISVAAMGLVFYGALAFLGALAMVSSEPLRNAAAAFALALLVLAVALDAVLFGVQAFAIGSFCTLCIATYGLNIAALIVLLPWRAQLAAAKGTLTSGDGGRFTAIWALGALMLLVFVVAVERGLAAAASHEPTTMLGAVEPATDPPPPAQESEPEPAPAPSPDPEPAPPPSTTPEHQTAGADPTARIEALQAQLENARARTRELEATLDDPQKYQEYQMVKATSAFEAEAVHDLALDGIPYKGPADAAVQVVEFSDFLCPYCRNLASAFSGYMPQSNGRVAIYFKNYPLDQACNPGLSRTIHDGACELALGAVCANEQDKFWPYHDQIFAAPPNNPSNDDVVRIATSAGLNGDQMRQCLDSPAAQAKLAADIDEAKTLEVNSTPTVYINGKHLPQIGGFLAAIESELRKKGLE